MEDLNVQVLQGFGIRAKKIVKEKSYYILSTDKGFKVVKKSMDTDAHVMFQHEVKEHLTHCGFRWVDRFQMSLNHKPYVEFDDNVYVMTDYLGFREADFHKPDDFMKLTVAVAQMHKLMEHVSFEASVFYGNENYLAQLKRNITEFDQIKKRIGTQKRMSDFDVLFLKNYEYYRKQMRSAFQMLEKTNLAEYKAAAKENNAVCHNLLKEEHIYLDREDIYITSFTAAAVDFWVYDLCSLIQRYIKKMPENGYPIDEILELYDQHHEIPQDVVPILYSLLKFPSKYIKICNSYYSKKRTWIPSAIINRVESVIQSKEKYDAYIDTLQRYL